MGTPVATVLQNLILFPSAVTRGAKLDGSLSERNSTHSTGSKVDIFDDEILKIK